MTKLIKKSPHILRTLNYRGFRPIIVSLLLLFAILFLQKRVKEQGPRNLQGLFDTFAGQNSSSTTSSMEKMHDKNSP